MHNPTIFRVSRNLSVIARISKSYENKKRGFSRKKILKSKIVRLIGLEPTRQRHQILSLARLPITPQAL